MKNEDFILIYYDYDSNKICEKDEFDNENKKLDYITIIPNVQLIDRYIDLEENQKIEQNYSKNYRNYKLLFLYILYNLSIFCYISYNYLNNNISNYKLIIINFICQIIFFFILSISINF